MGILSDIVNEDKVEMCPEACCGKPITECKCGPDCEHCDCHSKNSAINEGTMIGGLMKYDGQPEGEYADAVAKYKEFMSKPRPPGEATNTMVQGFVFDDDLLDNLGDAEEHGDILDVRFIVQSRLEDFFGDDFELSEGTQGCADCEWIKDETDGDIDTCDDCAAEKRQTNEAEKRWKQTSMSPQEAIAKYGKENVKVKKGALRNGNDMVEVFVESYSPGDEYADGMVSNCCGAPIMDYNDGFGRCSDCKEMASGEKEEEYYESTASGTYANVYYDYSEGFYMIDVYKDGKKVEEYDDYMGAMEEGNPIKDKFLELVKKAGLEPEGLPLVSTGGDEPDETGVFKNGKFNWHKSSSVSEGPFKGIGKQLMKRKLNKQYKKSDLANFDKSGIDTSGKTPDEVGQMKSDFYHDHMDKAARAKKAGDRLSGKKKVKESTQALTEEQFDEAAGEKDACYHKVKSRYKVWPSAYASGALVKCRKVGAKNWGNSKK